MLERGAVRCLRRVRALQNRPSAGFLSEGVWKNSRLSTVAPGTHSTGYVHTGRRRRRERNSRFARKKANGRSRGVRINIATLNIIDGRDSRLTLACECLRRHHVDIAVVTETKMNRFWPATAAGYTIVPTTATSDHCGGVALVFRTNAEWHVEDATAVGPNVVRCVVVHGDERTPLFGVYIPPSEENMTTMNFLTEAMRSVDCERAVVLGDLNVNWHRPREERHHEIVAGLQELSMRNVADGFKTRRHRQHWWSWRQRQEGTVVSALCDYVAGRRVGWRRHSSVDVRFPTDH